MSKGKLQKFSEMESFEHVVQAPFSIVKDADFHLKNNWAGSFFKNDHPLILELGCGKGEYTIELARRNPGINYVGIDIKGARMWKGAKMAKEMNLKNVAFLRTNIEILERFFGNGEVREIWLTFPDPQMKKTRKRLTSTLFLQKYRQFLSPSGVLHLKTDSNFMYLYTLQLAQLNSFEILAETGDLYNSDILDETLGIKTFYEKQWLDRGITIKYLAFRMNSNVLAEPETEPEKDEYRSFGRNARE